MTIYNDYSRISAALNGFTPTVNPMDDFNSSVGGGTLLFGGGTLAFQGGSWLWKNRGNYASAWQEAKLNTQIPQALQKQGTRLTNPFGNNLYWQELRNLDNQIIKQPKALNWRELSKLSDKERKLIVTENNNNFLKAGHYFESQKELNRVKQLAKEGRLSGKELRNAIKNIETKMNKAELAILEDTKAGAIKTTGFFSKAGKFINKYTGIEWANRVSLKAATKEGNTLTSKATRVAGKAGRGFIKGGGPLAFAIEFGMELPEVVKTYSKLGASKGTIQLGKSAFVAGASTTGFVAGAKVGGILGGKLGGVIGSFICPGIGTAIGAGIGSTLGAIFGGLAASWGARQLAKEAVGPTELEKYKNSKTASDTISMVLNKEQALNNCAELYVKAANKEIELDDETLNSIKNIISGNENKFEHLVQLKAKDIKKENKEEKAA